MALQKRRERGTKGTSAAGAAKDDALLKDHGNTNTEKTAVCFGWFFTGTDVFLDGAYDVELAAAVLSVTDNHVAMGLIQLLFDGHRSWSSTRNSLSVVLKACDIKRPNMDTLVALGSGASLSSTVSMHCLR